MGVQLRGEVLLLIPVAVLVFLALAPAVGSVRFRKLPEAVTAQILEQPYDRPHQHLVDLELESGRWVRRVWVAWGAYPALVGGRTWTGWYRPSRVVAARPHRRKPRGSPSDERPR
jgi:hypothetical protein